jgi:predicted dehydrogenase
MKRIGIIGGGLIGRERLDAVRRLARSGLPVEIVGVCDADPALLVKTTAEYGIAGFATPDTLLAQQPELTIVALPHDVAVPVTMAALAAGGRVLLEKPMGRDLGEAEALFEAGADRLWVGFNYRFFAGIRRAIQDARQGAFGRLIGVDILMGHGCAPGQEKTWKLDPDRAGGGCLIDPGVHLLDLALLLGGALPDRCAGTSWKGFWNTGIEEDVRLLLSMGELAVSVQVSVVRWRSTFRMELHGTDGYGVVNGRSRSYGGQSYVTGRRWGWRNAASQAASETLELESDGSDSFAAELQALLWPDDGPGREWPAVCSAAEALRVMQLLERVRGELGLI